MIRDAEQEEAHLIQHGWEPWTVETVEGRKIITAFWKHPTGEASWYFNEAHQAEYANGQKRYTLKDAVRVQRLSEETVLILAQKKAEAARKNGISGPKPVTAEEAAQKAIAAEAVA